MINENDKKLKYVDLIKYDLIQPVSIFIYLWKY